MRVVIADDAPLIREGVAHLLAENGVEVVAQVGDAEALLARVRDLAPDVALVDVRMPPTHTDEGLRAAGEIRERHPATAVLVLSQNLELEYALRLVEDRPERVGYLLKERVGRVEQLLDAVERVAAVVGPTRARPAKKVRIGRMVETSAMATMAPQPAAVCGRAGPCRSANAPELRAADVRITAVAGSASARAVTRLPTRMYTA